MMESSSPVGSPQFHSPDRIPIPVAGGWRLQFGFDGKLANAPHSVCGSKRILIEEKRTFADGTEIGCARLAWLEITDSPVHVHRETVETYQILEGSGRMVMGDTVATLQPGDLVFIPPGVPHALLGDHGPIKVLMTFAPGLAPVLHPEYRDETILHPSASARIAELTGETPDTPTTQG